MSKNLKNCELVEHLPTTFLAVEEQLKSDYLRWGDEWKKRGLRYKGQNQEERFFDKIEEYMNDFHKNGTEMPWTKIIGEAHICLHRAKNK